MSHFSVNILQIKVKNNINKVEPKIELKENRNGEKAWSPSSLVEILKLIEYGDKQIPEIVLQRAAKNGKLFHQIIQEFIQTGVDLAQGPEISPKVQKKLQETIYFLEKNKKLLNNHCFLGSERLHHTFYKGVLIATYVDLEFADCIVELKTNNIKMHEISQSLFEILEVLIDLVKKKDTYTLLEKRAIVEKILLGYVPHRLIDFD
ncbi:2049_t:CDS:2 [Entrophospora sp. SA101]|nr:2049_t:CDS:2 [Entrophospora sp. SA101]